MTNAPGKLAAALLMTALALPSLAHAVPQQLAQQGRLTDLDDVPLEGSHQLTFRIYTDLEAGIEVWSETLSAEFDRGFYSVVLGTDTTGNPLDELLPMAPPLYLELSVDDGAPLLPRQQLLAVPYAVMAGTARNVEGGYVDASEITVAGSTIVDSSGNWTGPTPSVDWSEITGIPSGLGDGGNSDTLAGLSCANEDRPVWSAAQNQWACTSAAVDLSRIDTSTAGTGQVLTYNGAQLGWEDPSSAQGSPCSLVQTAGNYAELNCNGTDLLIKGRNRYSSVGSAWGSYNCAIRTDGSIACWGSPSNTWSSQPNSVPPTGSFVQLAIGLGHGCALDSSGSASCWGNNSQGQGTPPVGVSFTMLAATESSTCGLKSNGSIECWGVLDGQAPTAGFFVDIKGSEGSGGYEGACAVDSGGAPTCWGATSLTSQLDPSVTNLVQISPGTDTSCGVDANGSVACWGSDSHGVVSGVPAGSFTRVEVAYSSACALDASGQAVCWGRCGDDLCALPPGLLFSELMVSSSHACGRVTGLNVVHCWGLDNNGNLAPP